MDRFRESEGGPHIPRRFIRRLLDGVRVFTVVAGVIALIGGGISIYAYRQVDRTEGATQTQLRLMGQTAAQSAQTLRSVTDASTQGAATVDSATISLTQVSRTIRDTAGTLEETAKVINFTIPITNTRPLAGVDENFRKQAVQLRMVATEIDQTTQSLAANGGNLRTIAQEVQGVSQNMDVIATQILQLADGPGASSVPSIAGNVRLVLIWSIVLHLLFLGFAISFYILATALRQMAYDAPRIRNRDAADAAGHDWS